MPNVVVVDGWHSVVVVDRRQGRVVDPGWGDERTTNVESGTDFKRQQSQLDY